MVRRMEYFFRNPLPAVEARFRQAPLRIWSGEHGAWWRPDGAGYTINPSHAGLYTLEEAKALTGHCGREKRIFFQTVNP